MLMVIPETKCVVTSGISLTLVYLSINMLKQECIPVRYVLPAAVTVCWGWGCLPQCMLGYTPHGPGPGHPPARPPNLPLGVGLEPPPQPEPPTSPLCLVSVQRVDFLNRKPYPKSRRLYFLEPRRSEASRW